MYTYLIGGDKNNNNTRTRCMKIISTLSCWLDASIKTFYIFSLLSKYTSKFPVFVIVLQLYFKCLAICHGHKRE
jgi:hypothetical protein